MTNKTLYATAALGVALAAASPALGARLRLPPARAPAGSIYSPAAIAGELAKRGYRLEKMKRKGTAYSVTATGPHGNRVQMLVDGRSGDIVGLTVVQAAANLIGAVAAAMKSDQNTRYYDDTRPFGVIVPDRYQVNWTQITNTNWNAPRGAPRYVAAPKSGRGYRYAVPYRTIRPAVGGGTRSTYSPKRMSKPVYDVYDSSGSRLETVETREDTMTLSQVTTEETTYSSQEETFESSYESSYFGGEVTDSSLELAGDYDAEDGDRIFADNPADDYQAGVETAGFSEYSATVVDEVDEPDDPDEPGDDPSDDLSEDDPGDDLGEDEPDDVEPEDDEPEDDEPEEEEPEEEEPEEEEPQDDDYGDDDGGDDGGDEDPGSR